MKPCFTIWIAHEPKQVDNIPTMIDLPVTDRLAGRLVKDFNLPSTGF